MLEKLPEMLGQALRDHRAGLEKIAFQKIDLGTGTAALHVRSPAFADHAPIPARYTADGEAVSPPLEWSGVPSEAGSLVLIVEDPDAPTPQPLVHVIAVGLPVQDAGLAEGALKSPHHEGRNTFHTGRNSYLKQGWLAPDPPPGHGQHRYAFQLFALQGDPQFSETPGRTEVLEKLREHAVASGVLIGTYERDTTVKVEQSGAMAAAVVAPASN